MVFDFVYIYRHIYRKTIFLQNIAEDTVYTLCVKNFVKMAVSRTVSEINAFLHFMQKFNMAVKNGGEIIFGKKLQTRDCISTQCIPGRDIVKA